MSVAEIAPAEAVGLASPLSWKHEPDLRLWLVHLIVSGLPFLLCVFLVGRISEGLEPGLGPPAMVALGLGTLLAPLATAGFSHSLAAGLGFLAFVLAWRGNPLAAGLAAGAGFTVEYESAAILALVLAYTAFRSLRDAARYVAGAVPGVLLLGAYDWAAFGAPWHTPLRYSFGYAAEERSGFLGVHFPTLHGAHLVFLGEKGLLVVSPVVVLGAAGLWLLWRRGLRPEALTCAAVTVAYVLANCGYFLPYGGGSPGPRFLAPALPFLALGFAPAFARWRVAAVVLTVFSVVATTAVLLAWSTAATHGHTVWGELGRAVLHTDAPHSGALVADALVWTAGGGAVLAVVAVLAVSALVVGLRPAPREAPGTAAGTA